MTPLTKLAGGREVPIPGQDFLPSSERELPRTALLMAFNPQQRDHRGAEAPVMLSEAAEQRKGGNCG